MVDLRLSPLHLEVAAATNVAAVVIAADVAAAVTAADVAPAVTFAIATHTQGFLRY